jgi:hypothetical protein
MRRPATKGAEYVFSPSVAFHGLWNHFGDQLARKGVRTMVHTHYDNLKIARNAPVDCAVAGEPWDSSSLSGLSGSAWTSKAQPRLKQKLWKADNIILQRWPHIACTALRTRR